MTTSYEYLQLLASKVTDELIITWGPIISNEWYELKHSDGTLYDVWMSGATPFALGVALGLPHRRIICLDGDGSMLMDLPVLPVIAQQNPSNLLVIVFDNEAYEAAGKVPTFTAGPTDLAKIAQGAGIQNAWTVRKVAEFKEAIDKAFKAKGTSFIALKVQMSAKRSAPRALDGTENKYRFIRHIESIENTKIIKPLGVSIKEVKAQANQ